ncbi:unnamed protein product, partial [Ilex paraguariensis]
DDDLNLDEVSRDENPLVIVNPKGDSPQHPKEVMLDKVSPLEPTPKKASKKGINKSLVKPLSDIPSFSRDSPSKGNRAECGLDDMFWVATMVPNGIKTWALLDH